MGASGTSSGGTTLSRAALDVGTLGLTELPGIISRNQVGNRLGIGGLDSSAGMADADISDPTGSARAGAAAADAEEHNRAAAAAAGVAADNAQVSNDAARRLELLRRGGIMSTWLSGAPGSTTLGGG